MALFGGRHAPHRYTSTGLLHSSATFGRAGVHTFNVSPSLSDSNPGGESCSCSSAAIQMPRSAPLNICFPDTLHRQGHSQSTDSGSAVLSILRCVYLVAIILCSAHVCDGQPGPNSRADLTPSHLSGGLGKAYRRACANGIPLYSWTPVSASRLPCTQP